MAINQRADLSSSAAVGNATFERLLKASGNGLIVSLSSIAGTNGIGSSIAYCAVKAGIDVMTKSLASMIV
jgi:NAD(P)-dependent dehydrogenase (short-subunit alcohol dehydrogenase family)